FDKARQKVLDQMKLARADAESFARKVMVTTKTLGEGYVKAINPGEMVGYAVRGLYRLLNEEMPQEIRDQLGNVKDPFATVKKMKEPELRKLLADVRERLGKREDLDDHKDVTNALHSMLSHLDPYTTYIDPESLSRFKTDT